MYPKSLINSAGKFAANGVNSVLKRAGVDSRLQFSLEPPATDAGYEQWVNAMRAVSRLPDGIPHNFRRKLWLTMAQSHLKEADPQWQTATCARLFSERVTADDDKLGAQIIKDLHRTGWAGLGGEQERVLLKRVLLAYARHNKAIGYCQGFNVIGALILDVVEWREADALAVMILLVERVLPAGYFDQTLRALTVDMAVLAELMHQRLPTLAQHLDHLRESSESEYEPPVSNVFAMQWLLTLFATCLPRAAVLRIWDGLLLDGSEMLLRTALAIWAKTSKRACQTESADEFYELMNDVCRQLSQLGHQDCNKLLQVIYAMSEFPYAGLSELRERHTWNIQPFTSTLRQLGRSLLPDDDDGAGMGPCLAAIMPANPGGKQSAARTTDLATLQKQYKLMKQRQKQAAVILQNAYAAGQARISGTLHHAKRGAGGGKGQQQQHGRPAGLACSPFAAFNHLYGQPSEPRQSTVNGTLLVSAKPVQPAGGSRKSSNAAGPSQHGAESVRAAGGKQTSDWSTVSSGSVRPRSSADGRSSVNGVSSGTIRASWSADGTPDTLSECGTPVPTVEGFVKRSASAEHCRPGEVHLGIFLFADEHERGAQQRRRVSETDARPISAVATRRLLDMADTRRAMRPNGNAHRRESSGCARHADGEPPHRVDTERRRHGAKDGPVNARPQRLSKEQLSASKSILLAAGGGGASAKANVLPTGFNPFPTKHKSSLIEREKQFGLY